MKPRWKIRNAIIRGAQVISAAGGPAASNGALGPGSRKRVCYGEITGNLARNAHQELAEILPAQQADEGPRRVLKSLNHVFAIFDSSLADPGRDIAHEIP